MRIGTFDTPIASAPRTLQQPEKQSLAPSGACQLLPLSLPASTTISMETVMKRTLLLMTGLTLIASGAAFASESCSVPKAEWQPEAALRQKLEAEGWKINRVKVDDGCYEVYGTDGKGERAETYFNPKSFEVVKEG
jgi:hypothetical protein